MKMKQQLAKQITKKHKKGKHPALPLHMVPTRQVSQAKAT